MQHNKHDPLQQSQCDSLFACVFIKSSVPAPCLFTRPLNLYRFGGFGSDLCSGNYEESWKDRSEFVKLAIQRAKQRFPGVGWGQDVWVNEWSAQCAAAVGCPAHMQQQACPLAAMDPSGHNCSCSCCGAAQTNGQAATHTHTLPLSSTCPLRTQNSNPT